MKKPHIHIPAFIKAIAFSGIASMLILNACSKDSSADAEDSSPVPNVSVNVSINIKAAQYTSLATVGGVAYVSGGYRGILLYRKNASTIMAYDRTCTYDLPDAGGIVDAQTNQTIVCVDCGSSYSVLDGSVLAGPSTLGLKSYTTNFNTTTGALTVTN